MRAERFLQIKGGHNFRDMGGYTGADGRTVRWGQVYRSGVMSKIDPAENEALHSLGIVSICDLRTTRERRQFPTTWHEGSPAEMLARDYDMSLGGLRNLIRTGEANTEQTTAYIRSIYSTLLTEQAEGYRTLFTRLVEGKVPLVFNCSAGKDRTGIAAALILSVLGVSREDVFADYALTDRYFDALVAHMREDEEYRPWFDEDPDAAYPLLRAEPDYLEGMFTALDEQFGGLEPYLESVLGIGAAEIATIRANLLEG